MKQFDFGNVTPRSDGGFQRLEPGVYVCKIVQCTDHPDKEYLDVVYDIAEGPRAGYYSDDWGKEHPYAHRAIFSYRDNQVGRLTHRLNCITASNPGFDAQAAWNGGNPSMFVGRLVGFVLREVEQVYNGKLQVRLEADSTHTVQDVRDGKVKPLAKRVLKDTDIEQLDPDERSAYLAARDGGQAVEADSTELPDGVVIPF